MIDFPTLPKSDAGLPVPSMLLLATSIPVHWPKRLPRINGDTRRRKRRLREKLEKLDLIRYAPAIRAVQEEMKRRVTDSIERDMYANTSSEARIARAGDKA